MKFNRRWCLLVVSLPTLLPPGTGRTDAQLRRLSSRRTVDIDAGALATSKAADPQVKAFRKQMVTDHTGVNKQARNWSRLKVTPEDNATAGASSGGADGVRSW